MNFSESSQNFLKMCQESIWQYNPVGNKSWLKILKKCLFRRRFSQKLENLKHWIFTEVKIWPRVCYLQKIQIWHKHIFQVTAPQKAIFFRTFTFSCHNYRYSEIQMAFKVPIIETTLKVQLHFQVWSFSDRPCKNGKFFHF